MAPLMKAPGRLSAEGRADQEPLVANDSDAHRARNRRVEIVLRTGGA
jgi:type VI secretion system protein ImpK